MTSKEFRELEYEARDILTKLQMNSENEFKNYMSSHRRKDTEQNSAVSKQ